MTDEKKPDVPSDLSELPAVRAIIDAPYLKPKLSDVTKQVLDTPDAFKEAFERRKNDPGILSDEGRVVPPYEGLASMDFSDQGAPVLSSMHERLAARKRILENLAALDQQTLPSEARPKQRVTITKAFPDSFKEHLEDIERMRLRKRANRRKTTKKRKQRLMGKRN